MSHALYVGQVAHNRIRPRRHRFAYRVFWSLLDLDDLDGVAGLSRLFSHNRWNLFSFHDRDHGPRDGSPLRPWIEARAAEAGIDLSGGRVRLLSFPRILGYVFDPLSIWYCENADGQLVAVLYEVHNTFGESHAYLLRVEPGDAVGQADGPIRHRWDKVLYVSPFIDMTATYDFTMSPPDERLSVAVRETDADGPLFSASMTGRAETINSRTLLRLFVSHPLMTLKVMAGIHWEALWLWAKGAPYRSRPDTPPPLVSVPPTAVVR
ncbi:MAG: DUF1365 domain-containing protein [Acidimicrobiia bacterium]|nr:DUF1365 domain-containing protein [Acidimicrobiia bacterium]